MKLGQELFAIKLYEMEQQYGKLQSKVEICGQQNHKRIREELQKAKEEYREHALMLQKSVAGSRSPAVSALAKAQLESSSKMEELLQSGRLKQLLHSEKNSRAEDQTEAATLYAEYAMDYAAQAVQYSSVAALSAIDLQMCAAEAAGQR